jgi:hypothetical protein
MEPMLQFLGTNHYRIQALCRVPKTPGKGYFALGKKPPAKSQTANIS